MTLTMAAIYIAGVISGVILVVIALAGWIHKSALKIKEKKRGESICGTYSGAASVEDNHADRYQRRRRAFTTPT